MAEHPEPFSINVGSKLLFAAVMLIGLGVVAAILLPVLTAFGPSSAPAAGPEQIVGAVMPGIMLLIAGVVIGVIAGIFLGYAHGKYPRAK